MLMGYGEYRTIFSREPAYISLDMLIYFFQNKEIQTPFQFWILTLYFIHMLLINALFSYICLPVVQWMIWWTSSVLRMIDIPEEVDELLSCECHIVTHILSCCVQAWKHFPNSLGTYFWLLSSLCCLGIGC